MRFIALFLIVVSCAACSSTQSKRVVTPATASQQAELIDRVKSLAGTWELSGEDAGKGEIVFQVSSQGSVVREVMFPGTDKEMTNMYTMDGPELLMTHYCAMGNQPHMRAAASKSNRIEFKTAGVSNLTAADQEYMAQMTIVFVDANHIQQVWQTIQNGQVTADHATFDLTRRQ